MNPIALTHNGKTHAWLCSACHRVHTASDVMFRCDPCELHALKMTHAQKAADQCCRCLCGRARGVADSEWLRCERCRILDAWGRLCADLARAMAVAALREPPARQPCVPLPDPDLMYRRGDILAWKVPRLISEISERDYSTGWLNDIEYDVWSEGVRDDESDAAAEEAVDAARTCGVWWYYRRPISAAAPSPIMSDPNDYTGPWPVPLRTWCKMRAARDLVFRHTWFETAITVASQETS